MTRAIELLAPGGDLDAIRAAIMAGADAVYCGLDHFNARHRAANITLEDLGGVLALAHRHDCRVYLTLNIMMLESDIPLLFALLNKLVNTSLDGVIVQDLGLFYLLSTHFKSLKVHASTQLTTHNEGQLKFLRELGATRVNLSRELSIKEIRPLVRAAHDAGVLIEVFVHGSYCLSFSGICYLSSVNSGRSGNRGRCSQPCRDRYAVTPAGKEFPLNLKDNAAYFDLELLADAGVDALKIEGRMKAFHYVYAVTSSYSKRLDGLLGQDKLVDHSDDLHRVFNRGFSNAFLLGDISRQMFSEHPRNRSAAQLRQANCRPGDPPTAAPQAADYEAIAAYKEEVRGTIEQLRVEKAPLTVSLSGRAGHPLQVAVTGPDISFVVASGANLAVQRPDSTMPQLDASWILARLKAVNETEHRIERLDLDDLQPGLFLPRKQFTTIRHRIMFLLNGSREPIGSVAVPIQAERRAACAAARLAVLVAPSQALRLCDGADAEFYVKLPDALASSYSELLALLSEHRRLLPWFPSVLIGEDYAAAVRLLHQLRPECLVTNNTGIAYEAWRAQLPWIAGPQLNTANSHTLLALKQRFACHGAFVSHELSQGQIRRISPPEGFALCYSIYQPILLLTSRQCLFHQVTGCDKDVLDRACISYCARSSTITDLKGAPLFLEKSKGSYCCIHHRMHFLNTDIVSDLPSLFSRFFVDLRDVASETRTTLEEASLLRLFADHLRGGADSAGKLKRTISPTTDAPYRRGV